MSVDASSSLTVIGMLPRPKIIRLLMPVLTVGGSGSVERFALNTVGRCNSDRLAASGTLPDPQEFYPDEPGHHPGAANKRLAGGCDGRQEAVRDDRDKRGYFSLE